MLQNFCWETNPKLVTIVTATNRERWAREREAERQPTEPHSDWQYMLCWWRVSLSFHIQQLCADSQKVIIAKCVNQSAPLSLRTESWLNASLHIKVLLLLLFLHVILRVLLVLLVLYVDCLYKLLMESHGILHCPQNIVVISMDVKPRYLFHSSCTLPLIHPYTLFLLLPLLFFNNVINVWIKNHLHKRIPRRWLLFDCWLWFLWVLSELERSDFDTHVESGKWKVLLHLRMLARWWWH